MSPTRRFNKNSANTNRERRYRDGQSKQREVPRQETAPAPGEELLRERAPQQQRRRQQRAQLAAQPAQSERGGSRRAAALRAQVHSAVVLPRGADLPHTGTAPRARRAARLPHRVGQRHMNLNIDRLEITSKQTGVLLCRSHRQIVR